MTVEELQAAWDDLQAWRADQLALRGAVPSGRAVSLDEYLAAHQAMTATFGTPGVAQQAAVRAWLQAGADLTPPARQALLAWLEHTA